jgi:hypothetical protein
MPIEKIYIAGPMSGYDDHNKAAFLAAEEYLISLFQEDGNYEIFNPINHEASLMVQKGLVRDTQEAYRMCMSIDCNYICTEATMIYMLKDWEHSKGAMAEWTLAKCLGIRIEYQ